MNEIVLFKYGSVNEITTKALDYPTERFNGVNRQIVQSLTESGIYRFLGNPLMERIIIVERKSMLLWSFS